MKAPSLVGRLALLQLVVAAILLSAFAAATVVLASHTLDQQEGAFLTRTASDLVAALDREWSEEHDLRRAAQAVLQEDAPLGVQVEILDERLERIQRTPPLSPRPRPNEVRSMRAHVPRGAWIVVSVSVKPRRDAIRSLTLVLILVGLPLFALTAVVSRTLASRMLRPLRSMALESQRASQRGVVTPLGHPDDPIELQQLARSFNMLLNRLDRMLQGERMFTQDAAHELRTPLTVISGEIEYALTKLAPDDPGRTGLLHATEQAAAMSDLIEALLFLRRAEVDSIAGGEASDAVNLSDIVREATARLLEQCPRRSADVELATEDEVLVAGNGALLAAAIHNLIGNALKFTKTAVAIRVTARASEPWGIVVVEDGGKGILPDDRERVFDPFFRDSEARAGQQGFGLGLALLRRIVRAHGGEVVLGDSALGGARFEVRLPAWRGAGPPA